jgi:RimJ/RimL family protein N-acetyltransferase
MDATAVRDRVHGMWARQALESEGEALTLGVELSASGELIGDVILMWHSAEHRGGEIGYLFNPAFAGQGYATEAAHRVLHLAFDDLGLHRVMARVDADNHSSARLAARLGMRREAHLVQNEWFKGRWSDELGFAILVRRVAGDTARQLPHRHIEPAQLKDNGAAGPSAVHGSSQRGLRNHEH